MFILETLLLYLVIWREVLHENNDHYAIKYIVLSFFTTRMTYLSPVQLIFSAFGLNFIGRGIHI